MRRFLLPITFLIVGLLLGGYLFSRSIPRSFLAVSSCGGTCYKPNEIAGLLASAGIQTLSSALPGVERESNECLAIRHPQPEGRMHFVLFPKRDSKNILELTLEDQPFVIACFALARELVREGNVHNWRLVTNGPALQHVTYLHFHLIAK
ncbi:HIT domain-containing protein [Polaromonas sp.]|uniref:HIT domain-containing protein n=1 Tax=Polaromonas sp. TaxID=1869339 RepID=UPI002D7949E3|nr:HIT domain-containing protein [Polaromonas sp.]